MKNLRKEKLKDFRANEEVIIKGVEPAVKYTQKNKSTIATEIRVLD